MKEEIKIRPKRIYIVFIRAFLSALIWLFLNAFLNSTEAFLIENIWVAFALLIPSIWGGDLIAVIVSAHLTVSNFEKMIISDSKD